MGVSVEMFIVGQHIVKEGDEGSSLYIINKGQVDVSVGGTSITRLDDGSFFGEVALLGLNKVRTASVQALSFVDTRVISRSIFVRMLKSFPFERALFEAEANRRSAETQQLVEKQDEQIRLQRVHEKLERANRRLSLLLNMKLQYVTRCQSASNPTFSGIKTKPEVSKIPETKRRFSIMPQIGTKATETGRRQSLQIGLSEFKQQVDRRKSVGGFLNHSFAVMDIPESGESTESEEEVRRSSIQSRRPKMATSFRNMKSIQQSLETDYVEDAKVVSRRKSECPAIFNRLLKYGCSVKRSYPQLPLASVIPGPSVPKPVSSIEPTTKIWPWHSWSSERHPMPSKIIASLTESKKPHYIDEEIVALCKCIMRLTGQSDFSSAFECLYQSSAQQTLALDTSLPTKSPLFRQEIFQPQPFDN